jgi:hypothetical protein
VPLFFLPPEGAFLFFVLFELPGVLPVFCWLRRRRPKMREDWDGTSCAWRSTWFASGADASLIHISVVEIPPDTAVLNCGDAWYWLLPSPNSSECPAAVFSAPHVVPANPGLQSHLDSAESASYLQSPRPEQMRPLEPIGHCRPHSAWGIQPC